MVYREGEYEKIGESVIFFSFRYDGFSSFFFLEVAGKKNCISIFYLCGAVLKMTCDVDHEVIVNNGNEYIRSTNSKMAQMGKSFLSDIIS